MSHYNVNGGVPKTLIQHLIRWVVSTDEFGPDAAAVLSSVLATEISPELVPSDEEHGPGQRSEDFVGPYELQDFNLYHLTRFGYRPSKVAYLAQHAWGDAYDLPTIVRWLDVFLRRFHANQFKRSAVPNGPKVGSGGSLSPRGDWRAPSDASARAWLEELHVHVPGSAGDQRYGTSNQTTLPSGSDSAPQRAASESTSTNP
jgi:NAD+ synthase (glutamine-hydrolysing)